MMDTTTKKYSSSKKSSSGGLHHRTISPPNNNYNHNKSNNYDDHHENGMSIPMQHYYQKENTKKLHHRFVNTNHHCNKNHNQIYNHNSNATNIKQPLTWFWKHRNDKNNDHTYHNHPYHEYNNNNNNNSNNNNNNINIYKGKRKNYFFTFRNNNHYHHPNQSYFHFQRFKNGIMFFCIALVIIIIWCLSISSRTFNNTITRTSTTDDADTTIRLSKNNNEKYKYSISNNNNNNDKKYTDDEKSNNNFTYNNQHYHHDHMLYYHDLVEDTESSQATKRFQEWDKQMKLSFEQRRIERIEQRKDRISNQKMLLNNNKDYREGRRRHKHSFTFVTHNDHPTVNIQQQLQSKSQQQSQSQQIQSITPCGITTQLSSKQYPHLYPTIHTITQNSVIIITGILSQIGFHLAIKLITECNVQSIIGIDPMIPNIPSHRMYKINQLRYLYTLLPSLQQRLILPYVGFNPKESYNHHYKDIIDDKTGEIDFSALQPTHVIHIMSIKDYNLSSLDESDSMYIIKDDNVKVDTNHDTFGRVSSRNNDEGQRRQRRRNNEYIGNHLFGLRQNLIGFDHLLSKLTNRKRKKNNHESSSLPIHFTLVSNINVAISSQNNYTKKCNQYESIKASNQECNEEDHHYLDGFHLTAKIMEEVMFEYYKRQGLATDSFVTVRLPSLVYGPWSNPGSIDYDLAEAAISYCNDNEVETCNIDTMLSMIGEKGLDDPRLKDLLYVDDAINAILPVMQYRQHGSSPSSFNILSGEKVSSSRLAEYILSVVSHDDHQLQNLDMMRPSISDLAWKYLNFNPKIGLKNGITKLVLWHLNQHPLKQKVISTICKDENNCLLDQEMLPCASECSYSPMCMATGFDEVISTSQRLTQKCPYVIYTSSFDPDVKAINIKAPSSSDDSDFCKIAFVSKTSYLVTNNKAKIHKGWHLITVDWDNDTAQFQAKKWLPKLSPGNFFHKNVRYAIYLQDDLAKTPSLDDMLFILSLMTWQKQDLFGNVQQSKEAMILLSALEKPNSKGTDQTDTSLKKDTAQKVMTMVEAREQLLEYRGINHQKGKLDLQRRISLSQQASLLLNRCEFSTSCQNIYKYTLRNWVKTKWVVHNLQLTDAKDFRCDWYKEHIKLNDDFDEFSFAHVMAVKEMEHFLYLDNDEETDDETDTRAQMLERSLNGDLKQWISVGNYDNQQKQRKYVHIVDTEKLVDSRRRWNLEKVLEEKKASK